MSHPLHLDVNVIAHSASDATGQSNDSDRKYLESSQCQIFETINFFFNYVIVRARWGI